jgi:hypothetical protein
MEQEDTYVYISVKLYLKDGQTEDAIQEVIQEMDYSFDHHNIVDHEIVNIIDTQIPALSFKAEFIDPFDLSDLATSEGE